MHIRARQCGMTTLGWLIVLALIGFFTLITLRLAPVYLEYYKVVSSLDSLREEPQVTRKTKLEIQNLLDRRFQINDVHSVQGKDAKIEQRDGVTHVELTYEVRVPLMGNLDAVARFDRKLELISR